MAFPTNCTRLQQIVLVLLAAILCLSMPLLASAQPLRGTNFATESGDHTVEWNENWIASLTAEDEFSTMVMLEGQIMIYSVMFIHDENLGLSERAVYHSLSGVLVNSFAAPPTLSVEWEGSDGAYRGAHILELSGIDFVLYLRVDPAASGSGPIMQFGAAPLQAFPVSLEAMQNELLVNASPVFEGDDGSDVMARLERENENAAEADAPSDAAQSESAPAPQPQTTSQSRPIDDRSRLNRDAQVPTPQPADEVYTSTANGYTVTYPGTWSDMAQMNATVGEFSLTSDDGRSLISFSGRPTTETNRQAFFEEIVLRESRNPGYIASVISDDRLLIATWAGENQMAFLEYVFVDDNTVVTIMVMVSGANQNQQVQDLLTIQLNGESILRDWAELWPAE